jgi:hypothetical protein
VTKVVFLLVPGLHLLDLAGPAQAFGTAAGLGCGYELAYVAGQEDVPTAQGLAVRAATQWPVLATDDLIIVPGWRATPAIAGTGPLAGATLEALAAHHADGGTVVADQPADRGADGPARRGVRGARRGLLWPGGEPGRAAADGRQWRPGAGVRRRGGAAV